MSTFRATLALGISLIALIAVAALYYSAYVSYGRMLEEVEVLRRENADLRSELTRVSQDVLQVSKKVDDSLGAVGSRISSLEGTVLALGTRVSVVEEGVRAISKNYEQIVGSVNTLTAGYSSLVNQYNALQSQYNSLKQLYDQLRERVDNVATQVQVLVKYKVAVESTQVWYYNVAYEEEFKKLLEVSETMDFTKSVASSAGISPADSLEAKAWKLLNYMARNLMYEHDVFARVVTPDGSVDVRMDIIQLPNETMKRWGGDCDDLALFAYSVLRTTAKPGEEVYTLFISGSPSGHALVIGIDRNTRRFYVIDPTASFMNGYSIYMKMCVACTLHYYVRPPDLNPNLKNTLLNDMVAELVYVDEYVYMTSGAWRELKQWPQVYNLPVDQQIAMYLKLYKITPVMFTVASSGEVQYFTSFHGLASWINQKLYS